jgi:hypothetical protein
MGGGDGSIIVQDSIKADLGNPLVSGKVPTHMAPKMHEILARDASTWTVAEFLFLDICRVSAYCAIKC